MPITLIGIFKIARHAGDDLELLIVLLAKHGVIGTGLDEELGHNCRDTIKELRAKLIFKTRLGRTVEMNRAWQNRRG